MKCEIDFHNSNLTCVEQNSLSGYCHVSSRSTAMAFYDMHSSLRGFQRKRSMFHLQRRIIAACKPSMFQTSDGAVVKINFTFHYESLRQPV